eukprot:SAG31_NODE_970_length_10676_cov_12.566985_10_plen_63_part_00
MTNAHGGMGVRDLNTVADSLLDTARRKNRIFEIDTWQVPWRELPRNGEMACPGSLYGSALGR